MSLVGLGNTRVLTDYAQKSSQTLIHMQPTTFYEAVLRIESFTLM